MFGYKRNQKNNMFTIMLILLAQKSGKKITPLFPSDNLYPSDKLYPSDG